MKILSLVFFSLFFSACGTGPDRPDFSKSNEEEFVVRARTTFSVTTNSDGELSLANPSSQPVTVVVSPNIQMTVSTASFTIPTVTADTLSFGTLDITNLRDNNVKVCGPTSNAKCNKALIRVYTTGTAGPGFWNATDGYGAPLTASAVLSGVVGLGAGGAVTVQSYTIPSNKNVVRNSDFSPAPKVAITGDFSNAGAGTYTTTVVIEYGLSL